jgi:hypothetical protein
MSAFGGKADINFNGSNVILHGAKVRICIGLSVVVNPP